MIIAAAGGAAHLPGMAASKTVLPVLGVPMDATVMKGMDALLSIVQMPGGIPGRHARGRQARSDQRGAPGDVDARRSLTPNCAKPCGSAARR